MTNKELDAIDMTMFAGLITREGLDARAEHNIDESTLIIKEYMKNAVPRIFEEFNGDIPDREQHKLKVEAVTKVRKKLEEEGAPFAGLEGIKLRSNFVDGKIAILMGPVDKKMIKQFNNLDSLDSAKLLAQMATHEVKGTSIDRIKESRREDILDEIEDLKIIQKRKEERRARRKNKNA